MANSRTHKTPDGNEEVSSVVKDDGVGVLEQLLGVEDFEEFTKGGYSAVKELIGASGGLPDGDDFKACAANRAVKRLVNDQKARILEVIQMVLLATGSRRRIKDFGDGDKMDLVIDANDILLDRAGLNMDVMEGVREAEASPRSAPRAISGSWNRAPGMAAVPAPTAKQGGLTLSVAQVTARPQIFFKDKIDNRNIPWVPRIKEKPNSLKPLSILCEKNDKDDDCYSHPYEYELDMFHPSEEQLKRVTPVKPKPIEETDYLYVETEEQLETLMKELKGQTELAVDVEHHSYRTFMGITCLMQISTLDKDYLIDTLSLRDKLYVLNEIFTNPKVLKVFHGAERDVEWLQRDLCIYVVNMFDTYQASKVLEFPRLNLAFLLKYYCQVDANKQYQLYDWRTRPLCEQATRYAREDTHYLLYIYGMMSNQVLKKANGNPNLLRAVYDRSADTCKRRYTKPMLEEDSYLWLYRKGKRLFDNRQLYALKEIYNWRDRTARQEDESVAYVLPNHMLLQIAEHLPREVQGILACCNPIPPTVRLNLLELHKIILMAREQPLVRPMSDDGANYKSLTEAASRRVFDLDDDGEWEFRDDLPTLLDGTLPEVGDPPVAPAISFYNDSEDIAQSSKVMIKKLAKIENSKYLNPYIRYKLVLPFVHKMEEEEREKHQAEYLEEQKKKHELEKASVEKLKLEGDVILFKNVPSTLSQQARSQKRKAAEGESAAVEAEAVKNEAASPAKARPPEVKTEGKMKLLIEGERGSGTPVAYLEAIKRKEERAANLRELRSKRKRPLIGGWTDVGEDRKPKEEEEAAPSTSKCIPVINLELNTTDNRRPYYDKAGNSLSSFKAVNYKDVNFNKFHSTSEHNFRVPDNPPFIRNNRGKRKQPGNTNFGYARKRNKH